MDTREKHAGVYVWDPLVRLFHWSLVILLGFSWFAAETGGNWMQYHMWSGYTILTLVLVRIAWGFLGTSYARFSSVLHPPRAVIEDLRLLPRREARRFAGHTPLGGINIVLLLICVLLQAGTGLFANDDIFTEGPLYAWVDKDASDWLTMVHHYNFNVLLLLVGLHVAAVFYHLIRRRENLIVPMVTGLKKTAGDAAPATVFRPVLATALLGAAASVVYLLVNWRAL